MSPITKVYTPDDQPDGVEQLLAQAGRLPMRRPHPLVQFLGLTLTALALAGLFVIVWTQWTIYVRNQVVLARIVEILNYNVQVGVVKLPPAPAVEPPTPAPKSDPK